MYFFYSSFLPPSSPPRIFIRMLTSRMCGTGTHALSHCPRSSPSFVHPPSP
jgi:hypothetical protein